MSKKNHVKQDTGMIPIRVQDDIPPRTMKPIPVWKTWKHKGQLMRILMKKEGFGPISFGTRFAFYKFKVRFMVMIRRFTG